MSKKATEATYAVLNVPLLAYNYLAARTPRVQASAVREFQDITSREIIAAGVARMSKATSGA